MNPQKYIDVFPIAKTDKGLRFLLLRRSQSNSYPGIWQPVAGKVKTGETSWQAGLRELGEETGLTPNSFFTLDHVSTYYLHSSDDIVQVPAFIAEVNYENPILNHEHDAFKWLSLEKALTIASWEPYRKALACIPKLLDSSPAMVLAKISLKK